jgi:MFS family permease
MTVGLVLLVTLIAFEALAVNTVMPEVKRELGGIALYGWVFSGFTLSTIVSISISGREADRRGLAPVLATGVMLFSLGLIGGGAAPSMGVLVGARVVQGLGAGAISAIANVAIGRAYPQWLRPRLLAVLSTSWVVPGLAGPGLAALIATLVGWRMVFFCPSCCSAPGSPSRPCGRTGLCRSRPSQMMPTSAAHATRWRSRSGPACCWPACPGRGRSFPSCSCRLASRSWSGRCAGSPRRGRSACTRARRPPSPSTAS